MGDYVSERGLEYYSFILKHHTPQSVFAESVEKAYIGTRGHHHGHYWTLWDVYTTKKAAEKAAAGARRVFERGNTETLITEVPGFYDSRKKAWNIEYPVWIRWRTEKRRKK